MTPQQLEERREKWLFFNCDSKYSKVHKSNENKLFYIDCEEEEPKEEEASQEDATSEEINPTISFHAPYIVMHWLELALLKLSR